MYSTAKKRVCIIGAGPRGLVTARHLSEVKDLEIVVFESKEDVGGMWLYKEVNAADPKFDKEKQLDNYYHLYKCFHSSMYESLVTNLPYFFMEYKDLSMIEVEKDLPIFINVDQYKIYLDAYAEKFKLRRMIQFNTLVKSVRLSKNLSQSEKEKINDNRKFVVKTTDGKGESLEKNEKCHSFDYIIVTSGQYSFPYVPEISNIEHFHGHSLHCKDFRTPNKEIFEKKKILVLGGGASCMDMLIQFFSDEVEREEDCEKMFVCSRHVAHIKESQDFKPFIESGKLVIHEGSIKGFKERNIACFSNGAEEEIDTIIYATGYKLKFPYFDQEVDKIIDHDENEHRGAFFGPTYKKFAAIREPDVFFIGYLEMTSMIHILPELQALTAKYIIEGKLSLPSQKEMMEDFNKEVKEHLENIGDLAHFYKTNLAKTFKNMDHYSEQNEWLVFSNWLKPVHQNNNEKKAQEFFHYIMETKKKISEYKKAGEFLSYKKINYLDIFPKEFRNTSDFV